MTARKRKTRVKSTARAEKMAARWKDPAYAAKMREAAKRGAATANAKRKKTPPPPHAKADPPTPPTPPAAAPTPTPPAPPKKEARTAKSWTPGRAWR